ncbi:MAG: hypothetical protein E7177_04090 [Erysipelotrichaceae bacterium]|nr:hypothetical protein [Erysipelotrichaceae bacterium]
MKGKSRIIKNSPHDFSNSSLPSTRRQLVKKIFFSRFGKLVGVNLLCFLFFVPILTWGLLATIYKSSIENLDELVNFVITVESPLSILFYIIAFIGVAGSIYYIRKLTWGEPVNLFKTFLTGIKQSYKQFIVFGIIYSILICLFELAFDLLRYSNYEDLYLILFIGLLGVGLFLFLSIMSYSLTMSSLYYLNVGSIIKSSFLLTIKKVLTNLLICLATYGIVLTPILIGNVYLYFASMLIIGFIGISYCILIWVNYANSSYDVYINLKQYPDYFRKGLKKEEKEGVENA